MSVDTTERDASRALQALHAATWFALCEGDRYSALGRRAVANSFYNLLPLLAEVRKAMGAPLPAAADVLQLQVLEASGSANDEPRDG
ncbi:hypothetical protein ABU614_09300 [Lysobacter firmicutimachus]|uniref:Uncharacterized protein n=1 Tax=Lysobacter firmicutimachus TaxID=1792846 RepID=A0AAU8MWI8_9GAMM